MVATMRLAPRKRPVPLVELVAAAVPRLAPGSVRLTIIGDGPARPAVEAAIAARGMDEVIRLAGRLPREELQAMYRDADVFLAPAELEAFGIAALEARTSGLALVARRGTGIAEFVRDGVDGFLVADDREMSEAVVLLARDAGVLAEMRRHNAFVRPRFDWSDVLTAVETEYGRATALTSNSKSA
jgi:glycosyltransferase involved in cell wall biosynthesis